MEEEGLNTLENRILNLEKALGFPEENSPTKLKLESKQLSLINKLQFVEYKTKEIYMSQIHNLIEKGKLIYLF